MCFSFFIIDNARNRRIRQTLMTFIDGFCKFVRYNYGV